MAKFVPDPSFDEKLQSDPMYRAALKAAAEPAAAAARNTAHAIMPSKRGRDITVVVDGKRVLVSNPDHGAHLDEWGSKNNPPYAPLRRGVRAAGLKFKESGK